MNNISAKEVQKLRAETDAKMMDCKKALVEADGDFEKAKIILREKGQADAQKRSGKATMQGAIGSYIHGCKIGVMVEINCETDFVARNEDFQTMIKDICMHVAASNPLFLSRDEVPAEEIEREKSIYKAQVKNKPENIIDKIVEGKLDSYFKEICLLEQPFVKDDKKTVGDIIIDLKSKTGENITLRRFARWELGSK